MNLNNHIESLKNLRYNQKPLWGKMTPQHMVEHLYKAFQSSINEIQFSVLTEERKIPIIKRIFLGEKPLPKEFMNPAIGLDLLALEFSDLNHAITELQKVLTRFEIFFQENPSLKTIHPVFGYLTKAEWDIFHEKHIKHHLSQFGIPD